MTARPYTGFSLEATIKDVTRAYLHKEDCVCSACLTVPKIITKQVKKLGDFEQVAKVMEQAVNDYGVWNVLSIFPDMLRSICMGKQEENYQRDLDYEFAADVIEAFLPAIDLNYGEMSNTTTRRQVLAKALADAAKVST